MVLLTMTPAMVEALEKIQSLSRERDEKTQHCSQEDATPESKEEGSNEKPIDRICSKENEEKQEQTGTESQVSNTSVPLPKDTEKQNQKQASTTAEPSVSDPKVGNPISHGQVIDISKQMRTEALQPSRLEELLRGSRVYIPPPKPKPEPTSEYKALMARLRREEEARSYERMTNPPQPMETFSQIFPSASAAHAFSSNHQLTSNSEEDELTYADVNRQMTLIFNVLISIVCCAAAIWIAAKWWSTPARLALSMSGSMLVGVAEVVVYSGYIRRVGEAKGKEKGIKEVKEVVKTWVIGGPDDTDAGESSEKSVLMQSKEEDERTSVARNRKKPIS